MTTPKVEPLVSTDRMRATNGDQLMDPEEVRDLYEAELAFVRENAANWEKSCKEAYEAQERLSKRDDDQTAELAKTRAVVQALVNKLDSMPHTATCAYKRQFAGSGYPCICGKCEALALAKELNITPQSE